MRCHTVNTLGPHGAQVPAEILEKSWRNPRDKTSHGLIYRRVSPILLPPVNDRYSRPKFLRFSVTLFLGEFPLLRARVEWARMMERVAVSVLRNENLTKVWLTMFYLHLLLLLFHRSMLIVLCEYIDVAGNHDTIMWKLFGRKCFTTILNICIMILMILINLYFYIIEKLLFDLYFLAVWMIYFNFLTSQSFINRSHMNEEIVLFYRANWKEIHYKEATFNSRKMNIKFPSIQAILFQNWLQWKEA